ncbi:uncharacterized protein LOC135374090 isoform X2 [Ornithodoros turicata]
MLIYGMACIPLRLSEKGCDQRNIARLKKMWGKLIEAACEPSNWNCLLEAKCDAPTISDANTDCYKTYNQEHGVNTRKPSDPLEPSGDVELLCCMLKYNKYCVPKLLEEKGCHPDAVLRSGTAIETRMKTTCPSSKPKCVPPPQCNDKTLSDARLICEQRYKEAHEPTGPKRRADLQPRDLSREEMHKEHCCVMEYSRDCVLGYLKEHGCSDPDFLEIFLENIRTECGASKWNCTECKREDMVERFSEADAECDARYRQEHGLTTGKPTDLVPDTTRCCMLLYGKDCVPLRLVEKGCDAWILASSEEMWSKRILAACDPSTSKCLQCNQKTISDAEDVCLRKYEQEHGIISRGLMSGNDKRLCCTLDYKKNCVPDQLKAKGCDEQLLQNYVAKIQREITNQCAASNSICDVASKCPNKTLSLAQTVCEESFMREHGLVLPPEYVNKEANKWYCCMMQYSQNCLQDTLKQQGCDSEDFLQGFTRKVETQCGTSKSFCSAQCNNNTLSHAQFACSERYMQIHVLNPEKPGQLSPDAQIRYCCMMEYSKTCLPELLKQQGCDDTGFVQLFIQRINRKCGTFKLDCVPVPKCDPKAVSNAENDCATKYKQLYGLTTRKPDEKQKPAGLSPEIDKQWCCSMEYSKNCVTEVLKDKRCGDEFSASFLEQKKKIMANLCGTSKLDCEFDKSKSAGCMKYPAWTLAAAVIVASVMKVV